MPEFEFVDAPPPPKHSNANSLLMDRFAEALRANPGRWGVSPVKFGKGVAASRASNIRRGFDKRFPKDEFEAVCRDNTLYIRYVGKGGPSA